MNIWNLPNMSLVMLNRAQEDDCLEITAPQLLAIAAAIYGAMWCIGALLAMAFRGMGL